MNNVERLAGLLLWLLKAFIVCVVLLWLLRACSLIVAITAPRPPAVADTAAAWHQWNDERWMKRYEEYKRQHPTTGR